MPDAQLRRCGGAVVRRWDDRRMTPDPDSLRSPVLLRAAACGAAIALALPLTGCMPGLGLGLGTKPDLAATVEGILAEVPHESVGAIAVDGDLVALTLVTADGPVAADGEGISATLLSAPQTRPDGSACVVRSTRRDGAPGAPHEILEHGLCEQSSSLSEGPVSLEQVSGSTLDTALGLAEQEHGIPRDAVGSFRLMTKGGAPSLQVTPFPGATDDPSSVDIPLTV